MAYFGLFRFAHLIELIRKVIRNVFTVVILLRISVCDFSEGTKRGSGILFCWKGKGGGYLRNFSKVKWNNLLKLLIRWWRVEGKEDYFRNFKALGNLKQKKKVWRHGVVVVSKAWNIFFFFLMKTLNSIRELIYFNVVCKFFFFLNEFARQRFSC